jgi:hypothetical protein
MIGAIVCSCLSAQAADRLTQADLLKRMIDLDRLALAPPAGERTGLFSSFDRAATKDRTGRSVSWETDNDQGQFLRRQPDGWDVLAEMKGPGAITRIWSADPNGQVRIELDGQVAIEAPFVDLFNGKLAPLVEPFSYQNPDGGGNNCYFPIGYAKSCKVLARESESRYQINYVSFPPDVQVETFRTELDEAASAAVAEVAQTLSEGLSDKQLFGKRRASPIASQADLGPGQSIGDDLPGSGTIRGLYVTLTDRAGPRDRYALHRFVIRFYWDGQSTPSVEAPLVDFFGSGFRRGVYASLALGTSLFTDMPGPVHETVAMYCYFPMPFVDGARFEIENMNSSGRPIGVMYRLKVDRTSPPENSLRFKARFRKEDPCQRDEYRILETQGAGRLVACVLNVDCPRRSWWGAGDPKLWIDRERFPSYFGTGTADFFGDANRLRRHTRPLHGATRTGPYGKNSAYRLLISDCVNFQRSLEFNVENLQRRDRRDTYYASVVYWYGRSGAKDFFRPLRPRDLSPPGLRIPGSIEIESNMIGTDWGQLALQKNLSGELSGETGVSVKTGATVRVRLPYTRGRRVRLSLRVHPRRPFESIEVLDAAGKSVGSVSYARSSGGMYAIGEVDLKRGINVFTLKCAGAPVLDCWVVERIRP